MDNNRFTDEKAENIETALGADKGIYGQPDLDEIANWIAGLDDILHADVKKESTKTVSNMDDGLYDRTYTYEAINLNQDSDPDSDLNPNLKSDPDSDPNPDSDSESPADSEDKNNFWIEFHEWTQYIFAMIICAIVISIFFGRQIGVEGESMFPTLHWYDKVIISNLFYTPKYGDIIVFQPSTDTFHGTPLVKRVIAVEGQTVDIDFETGEVFVNGIILNEPYINEPTNKSLDFVGPIIVPEGCIFVMGDNRNRSSDSRSHSVGFVDTRDILGKVLFLLIPGKDEEHPRDWTRLGNVYS